ncbi:MAG TPA: hypothetical protein VEC11_13015 [Allosphingosinicella sp.]|nr:hypothetical protein [Allosphingosinicella sp.]
MRLASVTANRHVFDGQVNGEPFRLLLAFDNGRSLRLAVTGDGSGMRADELPLDEPFDMGECGSIVIEDVTGSLFPSLRATEVAEVRALELDARQVGVQLLQRDGRAFCFWVDDDQLFWGDRAALTAHDWLDGSVPATAKPIKV